MEAYFQTYNRVLVEGLQRRRWEASMQSMYLSSAQDLQDAQVASSSQTLPRRREQIISRPQITSPGTILPSPEGTFIWQPDSRMFSSTNPSVVSPQVFEFERVKGKVLIESWKETQSLRTAKGAFKVSLIQLTIKDEDEKLIDELPVYLNVHVERRTSTGWESVYHEPKLQIDICRSRKLNEIIDIKTDGKVKVDENMNMKITIRQSENE
jgi:hypothetical protein